jgi:hypothetical protein
LPTEYRQHEVLRRHPAALTSVARYYADSCVEGPAAGTAPAAGNSPSWVPPHAADQVLVAYR